MSEAAINQVPSLDEGKSKPMEISESNRIRGEKKRRNSQQWTKFRYLISPWLGLSVAADNGKHPLHTIINGGATALAEYSDFADGRDAREGARLLNEPTTEKGAKDDHGADRRKFYSQLIGLAIRSFAQERNPRQGAIFASHCAVQGTREILMAKTREIALQNGIEAKARNLGKAKGWANGIGNGMHTITPVLPDTYRTPVQRIGNICLAIGTTLSIAALVDMKLHVRRELADQDQSSVLILEPAQTLSENEVELSRIFPDGTTRAPASRNPLIDLQ